MDTPKLAPVIDLFKHPKYIARTSCNVINTLKEKGRKAALDFAAKHPAATGHPDLWKMVRDHIHTYLSHSKFKPKD